jgi:magnesium-transporting ATPase (P-type)
MKEKFREEGEAVKTLPEPFPEEFKHEIILKEDDKDYKEMSEERKKRIEQAGHKYWEIYKANGLSNAEVKKRQELYGKNKLPEKKKTHWTLKLLHEWTNLFANLLWAAAALSFLGYGLDTSDASNVKIF